MENERLPRLRLLFELLDFHGWSASALWEDTKLGVQHLSDIERLAVVGNNQWEKGMALLIKSSTAAKNSLF